MFEVSAFFDNKITSVMKIDQVDNKKVMQMNIDIEFPSCPCDVLTVGLLDEMGTYINDDQNTLKRIRLGGKNPNSEAQGLEKTLGEYGPLVSMNDALSKVQQLFDDKEGCAIRGYLAMNRVKSKLTFNAEKFGQFLFFSGNRLNLTHTIRYLSFGRRTHVHTVKNQFQGRYGELSPLNDHTEIVDQYGKVTIYNLNIVPTTYHDRIGFRYPVFQFAYGIGSDFTGEDSVNFDLSVKGVTVNYYITGDSLLQFLTEI